MLERYSYSQRALFPKSKQAEFLNFVIKKSGLKTIDLAKSLKIHTRSLSDWRREKYTMPLPVLKNLCKKVGIKIPPHVKIKEPFWYVGHGSSAGALAVYKKYGHYGFNINPEYRKKKWLEWWGKVGKFNKNQYFVTRKIRRPKLDNDLAEFIGIVLGDGSITRRQVIITLNRKSDKKYAYYVSGLTKKIFGIAPSFYLQGSVWDLAVSRTELVKFLIENGLSIGNKVKQQVAVPKQIQDNDTLSKYCIRGLIDTDGSFYIEKHFYKNNVYYNCVINFTNRSLPLLEFVETKLQKLGFNTRKGNKYSICLSRIEEVSRYFKEIGSSNPKHYHKYAKFMEEKYGGVPKWS